MPSRNNVTLLIFCLNCSELSFDDTGHVCRMSDERISKHLLYGQLPTAERHTGGQRKTYKDQLYASISISKPATSITRNRKLQRRTELCIHSFIVYYAKASIPLMLILVVVSKESLKTCFNYLSLSLWIQSLLSSLSNTCMCIQQ